MFCCQQIGARLPCAWGFWGDGPAASTMGVSLFAQMLSPLALDKHVDKLG